jgi:hypothetical protein
MNKNKVEGVGVHTIAWLVVEQLINFETLTSTNEIFTIFLHNNF